MAPRRNKCRGGPQARRARGWRLCARPTHKGGCLTKAPCVVVFTHRNGAWSVMSLEHHSTHPTARSATLNFPPSRYSLSAKTLSRGPNTLGNVVSLG
jgi:hypothetical protein